MSNVETVWCSVLIFRVGVCLVALGTTGESREIWTSAFINISTDVGMMLVEVLLLGYVCCLRPSVHFAARVHRET